MSEDTLNEMREMMIAKQVARIIPEIKLVDAADFIAYIHDEHFANITDIIDAPLNYTSIPIQCVLGIMEVTY